MSLEPGQKVVYLHETRLGRELRLEAEVVKVGPRYVQIRTGQRIRWVAPTLLSKE